MTHKFVSFSVSLTFYFFIKSELVDEKLKARNLATRCRLLYQKFIHRENIRFVSGLCSTPNITFEIFNSGRIIPADSSPSFFPEKFVRRMPFYGDKNKRPEKGFSRAQELP